MVHKVSIYMYNVLVHICIKDILLKETMVVGRIMDFYV